MIESLSRLEEEEEEEEESMKTLPCGPGLGFDFQRLIKISRLIVVLWGPQLKDSMNCSIDGWMLIPIP